MLPGRSETCGEGHRIRTVEGVRPRAISEMPKRCKCGRSLRYSKTVEFHPSPSYLAGSSPFCSIDQDPDGDLVLDRVSVWSDDIYKGPVVTVYRWDTPEQVKAIIIVTEIMGL